MAPKVLEARAGDHRDVAALITLHQSQALAANTVCEGHALPPSAYDEDTTLTLLALRDELGELLGICGLKQMDALNGEIKTMHVRAEARGKGAGRALLAHAIELAQARGYSALWLETGTAPFFTAATSLYAALGFNECPPFAAYEAGPDSLFMMLEL